MWQEIVDFFSEGSIANYILDAYLIFVLVFFNTSGVILFGI